MATIESDVPFDQCLLWDMHHAYYVSRGVDAWQDGEIPFFSTSNAAYAAQHARLFLAHISDLEASGRLLPDAPIVVLECAGGAGVFASNFLWSVEEFAPQIHARLLYVFTDYLEKSLRGAATSIPLRRWVESGKVVLARFDITRPTELHLLDGATLPAKPIFVFSNYLCCVVPMKHLGLWGPGNWHQLIVTIEDEVATDRESYLALGKRIIETDVIWEWESVELADVVPDPTQRRALERAVAEFSDATIAWPNRYLPLLSEIPLEDGGAVLTCDFGTNQSWKMNGRRTGRPYLYANTLNQQVNTYLLAMYAAEAGLACIRTLDDLGSVNSVLTSRTPFGPAVVQAFPELYMRIAKGDDALDFWGAGMLFRREKEPLRALRFFLRCAEIDYRNPEHRYVAGDLALELGQPDRAIAQMLIGHELDVDRRFDFDFQLGRAYALAGDYRNAMHWYAMSVAREPHPVAWTNLGIIQAHEGLLAEAYHSYKQALAIDPRYALAEQRLHGLKDLVWLRAVRDFETGHKPT